ncbi:MAG: FAD-dependent thymidylate synthase [Thermotoga caldifontis]|uniref:FAD-dependent thymidylate synthase n=1 Tax=Thermotoga TaxID=2335 RepID=UPI0013E9C9AF|nr:FAD-dependent thymidylate synthase [Thermotoga sp. Ku-13t]KAF2958651.1 thymidylate synthase [Thermotoga sp. Ku-13t]
MRIKVLDKGFVELIDHMGDDTSVVRAARICHASQPGDEEQDRRLIEFLMKNHHETPFEHVTFTFHVKCPIFVARQWMRHRIASYNELSGRYTEYEDEFYIPSKERLDERFIEKMKEVYEFSYKTYQELVDSGVRKEIARMVLPTALYTQFIWTVNARSLMNFLSLRADSHAQWEMQQYALAVAQIFKAICPKSYEAFVKHSYRGDLLKG